MKDLGRCMKNGDPVKELIDACSGMGIQVHASFAVFKDPKAIQIAGGAEKAGAKTAKDACTCIPMPEQVSISSLMGSPFFMHLPKSCIYVVRIVSAWIR